MKYIDTHAHIDQPEFDDDRNEVLARAKASGLEAIIAVGICAPSSERCVALAHQHKIVHAAVGIQPNDVAKAASGDWDFILKLAKEPEVVALGETGLDRYWDFAPFELQQDYFDRHLRLSQASRLPFIVHMRDCDADILAMLEEARKRGPLCGVMHSFTGTQATAVACLELGMYISFAGMVTYKKSQALRDIAKTVPANRLLIETDSPYLSPVPVRKIRRNEPAHVVHTASCLAEARGIETEELAKQTTENARQLFNLPKS